MATRRSSRFQPPPAPNAPAGDEDASANQAVVAERAKPKAAKAATKTETKTPGKTTAKKSPAEKGTKTGAAKPGTKASSSQADEDKLSSLSPEIFGMIADNIKDPSAINALSQTSKGLYAAMTPRLYGRIAVAAMFHAHIPKLIRTLEPHLSIAQKKQLKKEGKYKGQQESHPSGVDQNSKPICATYVKQVVVGVCDPGRKHLYIVERYVEEAFKNMVNVEIVETRLLNQSISQSIASLANLKALNIPDPGTEAGALTPLAQIKNLKHLSIGPMQSVAVSETSRKLLQNSMSTLQSLTISSELYCNPAGLTSTEQGFDSLRSLEFTGSEVGEDFLEEFQPAINFLKLRELILPSWANPMSLFDPSSSSTLGLRILSIDMSESHWGYDAQQKKDIFAGKCKFISSFDTLTCLTLKDCGLYPLDSGTNPGLLDQVLQAILKHKNLQELRLSYQGIPGGMEIPYLGPRTVGDLIDGLPRLREFQFAPDENSIDDICLALLRASQLEGVTCYPTASWRSDEPQVLNKIISTFVSNAKLPGTGSKKVVWEDDFKLRRVANGWKTWAIASKFAKREKGQARAEKIVVDRADGKHEVWHQVLPRPERMHVGYDPEFEWVEKASRDMQ